MYVTGLGKATPNGDPNGLVLPTGQNPPAEGNPLYDAVQAPTVTVGGLPAKLIFAGLAPGYSVLLTRLIQEGLEREEKPSGEPWRR